jgi:glucosamine-phosphate N-acetyltransferase
MVPVELKFIKLCELIKIYSEKIEIIKLKYLDLLSQLTQVSMLDEETFITLTKDIFKIGSIIVCYKNNPLSPEFDIIASGTIIIEPKIIRGGKSVGHIEDIVTSSSYRGKGLGQDILELLIQEGREKNCYKIILDCKDNLKSYYEKMDFKESGMQMALYF